MKKVFSLMICLFMVSISFSQNRNKDVKMVKHTVSKNETVLKISKHYQVDPSEVYRNNRKALDGVSEGMVLEIPVPKNRERNEIEKERVKEVVPQELVIASEPIEVKQVIEETKEVVVSNVSTVIQHKVTQGETLYGLARKYNVSVNAIKEENNQLKTEGLKIGQIIAIPSQDSSNSVEVVPNTKKETIIKHKVEAKETLYGLSKRYRVSVDEILKQNKEVKENGLQIGQTITIKTN